jgi:predicted acetyltransferase
MDIRPIQLDEIEAFYTTFTRTMGFGPPSEGQLERDKKSFLTERSVAAVDAGAIVGTAYSHPFELTLPGGAVVPAAGVTAIATASTHRRRGIITQLKRRQLSEALERGEVAAILLASEGQIYGRFGYGPATYVTEIKIDTRDARLAVSRPVDGRTRIIDGETADKVHPVLYDRLRRARAGGIGRPQHFWESITADRDKKETHVVYENPAGKAEGYVRYAVKADWDDAVAAHKLTVQELTAVTPEATIGIWAFLLDVDLVREINAWSRPVDESIRWLLTEPRAYKSTTYRDMIWVRPLDVARLLSERTYTTDVGLTLEIADPFLDLGGTFALLGGPDGAECSRNGGRADLRMSIADLGAISLGGVPPSELGSVGRIEELAPGALRRADAAFLTYPRPWAAQHF